VRVDIRPCTPSDLDTLLELARRTYDETFRHLNEPKVMDAYLETAFDRSRLQKELNDPASCFSFLLCDDGLAGYLKLNEAGAQSDLKDPASLEIERIYVTRDFQGRGLGKILMDHAVSEARRRGKAFVWLGVWQKNTSAIAFYERMGFSKSGTHDFFMGSERQTDYIMRMNLATAVLPRWDLGNVYPGIDSKEFARDLEGLEQALDLIHRHDADTLQACTPKTPAPALARALDCAVELFNRAFLLSSTLKVYVESFVSTNSYDTAAAKRLSELEIVQVRVRQAWTRFQVWTKTIADVLPCAIEHPGPAREHSFILKETAEQAAWLMSGSEESLAAELSLSGASAWSKLQRMLTSRIVVDIEVDGKAESLPMPALINLRSHPEEPMRRRAYEAEIREWQKLREPLAACMNGVKGSSDTLNRRRRRADCLHSAIDQARIDRPTLEALLDAMKGSLPEFRRYFRAKAARLGKGKLAWWDLFAPAGAVEGTYTWDQARSLILSNFEGFSPLLRSFAERAFEEKWIDAEPRDGKVGGAFCEPVPSVRESRILCNFDGSLEQVSTVAHELGHGFHNDCAFRAGKTMLQQSTPMTLAETASIMCETIVNDALLASAKDPREQLALLENGLINESQVIVDIYSRFLFEKEVLERRARSELSADDLCGIMDRAQATAYGDALDGHFRHPYMWTWKPHYYIADLDFYNFPYAFGLLFGTGLYAVYRERGAAFVPDYVKLLASTGETSAADLARGFGIDIRTRAFWDESIKVISRKINRYCAL